MSLTKLFNFKYLLQNFKKSKMALILFFIIVPLFTSLMIISAGQEVFEFAELGLINIFGLYIIPFIFSFCLFGYVFKKTSVDFMGSMPISRKCIFITNTIGGIVLIVLLQLVTFLLSILLGMITECTIFVSMALDILIFQTIAYIFVFTIANLAMSLSGNVLTQIALTLLITFIVPFTHFFVLLYNSSNDYDVLVNGSRVIEVDESLNYTAPFLVANDGKYEFNEISMYKMIGLSIIYFIIGLIAFNKRKMEVAGESFENKIVHFVVKGLTLVPFVAYLVGIGMDSDFSIIMIVLAIITIYYFLYDLITNKRMKIRDNIVGLIFSVIAIYGAYMLFISIDDGISKNFDSDSIAELRVEDSNGLFNFETKDSKEIKELLGSMSSEYNYDSRNDRTGVKIRIIRFNGSSYKSYVHMRNEKLNELTDVIINKTTISDSAKIILGSRYSGIEFSKEEEKELKNELNRVLKETTYDELKNLSNQDNYGYRKIIVYEYRKHELKIAEYPINLSENIFKLSAKKFNERAFESIEYEDMRWINTILFYNMSVPDIIKNNIGALEYVGRREICDFIRQNYEAEVTNTKEYAYITGGSVLNFYTNNTQGLIDVLLKIYNEHPEEIKDYYGNDEKYYYDYPTGMPITETIDIPITETIASSGEILE